MNGGADGSKVSKHSSKVRHHLSVGNLPYGHLNTIRGYLELPRKCLCSRGNLVLLNFSQVLLGVTVAEPSTHDLYRLTDISF
jgi:hypothetical protein